MKYAYIDEHDFAIICTMKTKPITKIYMDKLKPKNITDVVDNIDFYISEMRKTKDIKSIPESLGQYIWEYFREIELNKEKLISLAIFLADRTYRYAASSGEVDNFTRAFFASVAATLWDTLQARGVDMFYILDNEIREDRFMLTIQLFAVSGVAVVTPYTIKENYHEYMTIEEQVKWVLSFDGKDFDPKNYTITIDSSEDLRNMEVIDLIKKYMKHTRNIAYIEKDDSVNYLDEVIKIAKESKYTCVLRNHAPEDPNVTVINE